MSISLVYLRTCSTVAALDVALTGSAYIHIFGIGCNWGMRDITENPFYAKVAEDKADQACH